MRTRLQVSTVVGLGSTTVLALVLSACGTSTAAPSSASKPPSTGTLTKTGKPAPACKKAWLDVSVSEVVVPGLVPGTHSATAPPLPAAIATSTDVAAANYAEFKYVLSAGAGSHTCSLGGWPTISVAHPSWSALRIAFRQSELGKANPVTLTPGTEAVAPFTITAPSDLLASGNICAGFLPVDVLVPGVATPYFIRGVPGINPICAAKGVYRLSVGAFGTDTTTSSGGHVRVTIAGGCPATIANDTDVSNPLTLATKMVPANPLKGLICRYSSSQDGNKLLESKPFDRGQALQLARVVDAIKPTPPNTVSFCPAAFGGASIIVFGYRTLPDVDLWYSDDGCQTLDNGSLHRGETGNPSFYAGFIKSFDSLAGGTDNDGAGLP